MRILTIGNMYPPHHLGGYELAWESWVRHAEAHGHEVRVLTTDTQLGSASSSHQVDADSIYRDLRWYWQDHDFPPVGLGERWRIERHNTRVLDRHLGEFHPRVVVWWAMAGMSTSLMERVRRAELPAVAMLCDYWLQYAPAVDAWMRTFAHRPRLARVVERLSGAVTTVDLGHGMTYLFLSDALRQGAARIWPALANSEVVHRGPDLEVFRPAPALDWRWRLLYLGRIDRRKGIRTAIEALRILPTEATLTIDGAGDDEHLEELHELVERYELGSRVSFRRTSRSRLSAAVADADALVFPVEWAEPWGLVPLEAMAVGRPVVATGLGGSGEYLEDSRNCLLFDASDGADGLSRCLRRLADDPGLRGRLIQGGRETVAAVSAETFNARVLAATERAAAVAPGPSAADPG